MSLTRLRDSGCVPSLSLEGNTLLASWRILDVFSVYAGRAATRVQFSTIGVMR